MGMRSLKIKTTTILGTNRVLTPLPLFEMESLKWKIFSK